MFYSTDRSSNPPNRPPLPISPRSRQSPQSFYHFYLTNTFSISFHFRSDDARASQMRRANSIAAGVMARQQHNKSPGERAPPPKPSSRFISNNFHFLTISQRFLVDLQTKTGVCEWFRASCGIATLSIWHTSQIFTCNARKYLFYFGDFIFYLFFIVLATRYGHFW